MDKNILKRIIFERHEVIKSMRIIERNFYYEPKANYILTGQRRAGKTTQLYSIVRNLINHGVDWNQIIFINFEDDRLSEFKLDDFDDILAVQKELSDKEGYFFFDEIQIIDNWEKFARRMADNNHFVYISGSNAKMLSREMETVLGGRYLSKYIPTYSLSEYLSASNLVVDNTTFYSISDKAKFMNTFERYFKMGGFPQSIDFEFKRDYLENIMNKILLGDILARNNLRNEQLLRILIKKIAETVTSEMSYSKLYNIMKSIGFKLSKDSIIDYIGYCKDAYLIFDTKNYFYKFIDKESSSRYYFNDNGILNLFLLDKDSLLLENIVAIYLHNNYQDLFYLKSDRGIDIDFYLPNKQCAIQVAYSINNIDTREREIQNLIKLNKSFNEAKSYIIITYDEEETINLDGITIEVMPVYKLLLGLYNI